MKNNKFCVNKAFLLVVLILLVVVELFVLVGKMNGSNLSYVNRAQEVKLKTYLNVLPSGSGNYVFLGLKDTSNQVTLYTGQKYYVWIENNSSDTNLAGPYPYHLSYCDSNFKTKYSNLFSLLAPGSSRLVQGEDDCMPHVFSVTYNSPGNYKINGVFRPYIYDPTFPGGQQPVNTPILNVTVK